MGTFCRKLCKKTGGPILTIYKSYVVFPGKMCLLGCHWQFCPFWRCK